MKRVELERRLGKLGWHLAREGHSHRIYAMGERSIAVPRHPEINEYTARAILKQAKGDENEAGR